MRFSCLHIAALFLLSACAVNAQDCPKASEKGALLQFLLDHRGNSLDADPGCVDRAFASLSLDKVYIDALVKLLDFERSIKSDTSLIGRTSQYPAIGALARLKAVPQLIAVIKESDSELVRTNAAHALDLIHSSCIQVAVDMLDKEAANPNTPSYQQERLREAKKYISEHVGPRPCYSPPSEQRH